MANSNYPVAPSLCKELSTFMWQRTRSFPICPPNPGLTDLLFLCPSTTVSPETWLHYSPVMPKLFLPQDICIVCSFYMECSSSRYSQDSWKILFRWYLLRRRPYLKLQHPPLLIIHVRPQLFCLYTYYLYIPCTYNNNFLVTLQVPGGKRSLSTVSIDIFWTLRYVPDGQFLLTELSK